MTDTDPVLEPVAETETETAPIAADPVAELEPADPVAEPETPLAADPPAADPPAAEPEPELEPERAPELEPEVAPAADTVPTGTIGAVLAWVEQGDDSAARAAVALETEEAAKAPRSTLIAALEAVIEAAAEAATAATEEAGDPPAAEPELDPVAVTAAGYRVDTTFTAMVGVQIVTFHAGDDLDPVLAAELVASGAPITVLED